MKKIDLSTLAGIISLCLVSIVPVQAMPRQVQTFKNAVSGETVCDQPSLCGTVVYYGAQEPHDVVIAKGDDSSDSQSEGTVNPYIKREGNDNPYVIRQGHGRARKKEKKPAEDNKDADDLETDDFGDDSAVKFNRGLKNSSGYNEDL